MDVSWFDFDTTGWDATPVDDTQLRVYEIRGSYTINGEDYTSSLYEIDLRSDCETYDFMPI